MARTTAAPTMASSASIPTLSTTLTPSASSSSLSSGATVTRLRSNSNLSGRLPPSPSDARSLSQAQGQQPTTPTTSLHPSPNDRGVGAVTPPPRPPRGPLRSPGAPRSPSMPSIASELSPSLRLCQRALDHSKDHGDTLDVSRDKKLDRIDNDMVEFFRTRTGRDRRGVWRLALSYNALRDGSIVPSFSKLNRLRYLNLKGNRLTAVPQPILELAGLEILDLSKNALVALPEKPGRLAHLKVLSLSHNALSSLPAYLADFKYLKVFKVDHNPIMWPPRDVLGPLIDVDPPPNGEGKGLSRSEEDLKPWIEGLRRWLRAEVAKAQAEAKAEAERIMEVEGPEDGRVDADEDATPMAGSFVSFSEQPVFSSEPTPIEGYEVDTIKRAPTDDDRAGSSPETGIGRTAGADSSESLIPTASSSLSLPSQAFQHDRSTSSSSVTPPVSASTSSSASEQIALPHFPPTPTPAPPVAAGHTRGASYTATQRLSGTLTTKKSLPDLRQSHAKIIEERRGESTDELRPLGFGIPSRNGGGWHQTRAKPFFSPEEATKIQATRSLAKGAERKPEPMMPMPMAITPIEVEPIPDIKRDSQDGPTVDESRNSYFRRLSMLPPSTISKAVSPAMLLFVDSIRGILFALTQLHSALRQYLNFAVPDRVAGVFARVLEPAGGYLAHLINALDRFDSMSRRSAPPATAVRGVVESAKESITVFGKVVAVLRLQTPAFKDADVRYTRSLLLSIYGGMSELVHAWRTMLPLLAEIRPILYPESAGQGMRLAPPMSQSSSMTGRTPISPIMEQRSESSARGGDKDGQRTPARTLAPSHMPPVGTSPRSKSRRHAGSFSAQDVERGMLMGSPVSTRLEWTGPPGEMARIFEGPEAQVPGADVPPFPLHAEPEPPADTPLSLAPRSRHVPTSSGSSYLSARNLSFDVRPPTPASATLFDDDLLDQIELATDVAFQVWLKLAEDIGASNPPPNPPGHGKADSVSSVSSARLPLTMSDGRRPPTIPPRQYADLVAALGSAEQVTATLRESLMGLRANPFAPTQWPIHDNAQHFIKTVVRVMELVKVVMVRHLFSTILRQLLSRLTQLTRECAILIQVSSHRPGGGHSGHSAAGSHGGGVPSLPGSHAGSHAGSHGGHGGLAGVSPHGHGHVPTGSSHGALSLGGLGGGLSHGGPNSGLGGHGFNGGVNGGVQNGGGKHMNGGSHGGSLSSYSGVSLSSGAIDLGRGDREPRALGGPLAADYASSNEDLVTPNTTGGGLRGLHLPARHGLRTGRIGGSGASPPVNGRY